MLKFDQKGGILDAIEDMEKSAASKKLNKH